MSEAPAGGAAPAPDVVTANGSPARQLTVAEEAEGAAAIAAEKRAAADAAAEHVEFTRAHAQGLIEGAEQAAADAAADADAAEQAARQAARAAGQEA